MYAHVASYPVAAARPAEGYAPAQVLQQGYAPAQALQQGYTPAQVQVGGKAYTGQAPQAYAAHPVHAPHPYTTTQGGVIISAPPTTQGSVIISAQNNGGVSAVPLTPKVRPANIGNNLDGTGTMLAASSPVQMQALPVPRTAVGQVMQASPAPMTREQVLEQKIRELESVVGQKDQYIKELQACLTKGGLKVPASLAQPSGDQKKARSPTRSANSFRKVSDAKPCHRYGAIDQDDPVDVRLEEFYNTTGSQIQFHRINRGFYRFGDSICELDIINHKLMARTEDGWNRGKFGPIEKFLVYYENIEREKAGILPEM